jgi:hypothetical protein
MNKLPTFTIRKKPEWQVEILNDYKFSSSGKIYSVITGPRHFHSLEEAQSFRDRMRLVTKVGRVKQLRKGQWKIWQNMPQRNARGHFIGKL